MINLKIGNRKIKLPNDWNEITISKYARIVEIMKKHDVKETTDEMDDNEKNIQNFSNLKANKECFSMLTGADPKEIERCNYQQITYCLNKMTDFLGTQMAFDYKEDDPQHSFTFKNKTYLFPKMHLKETTFGDYIEAAQLNILSEQNEAGRFGVLPEQMAIMCKTKDEDKEYNEKLIMKKTRLFEELPMSIVWQFVFFLTRQTNHYQKNFPIYSKTEAEYQTDTQQKTGQ